MKKFFTLFLGLTVLSVIGVNAQIFTSWNFNNSDTIPTTGAGDFITIGGVTRSGTGYASGPTGTGDNAYNTTTYPAASASNATAGFEVSTSTSGKTGIVVSFYLRSSNTASKYFQLLYSSNGTTFTPFTIAAPAVGSNSEGTTAEIDNGLIKLTAGSTFYFVQVKLGTVTTIENNANFAFRVVSAFAPNTTAYAAAGATSTYAATGTVRIDNISISSNNVLPVSLKSLTASLVNNQPKLNWETANEVNFSHFMVEKSTNAKEFFEIAKVESNKGSNAYEYTDVAKTLSQQYYRLKMVDKDGSFTHSAIVAVNGNEAKTLSVYPNPVSSTLVLAHPKAVNGSTLRIVSLDGKAVTSIRVQSGATQTSVDVSRLVKSNYIVEFVNNGRKQTTQMVKQ